MANLINYHGSDKVKLRLCEIVNNLSGVRFEVVVTLPQEGEANVIYLVPKTIPNVDNIYDEYIWIGDDWELIGDTEIDLSNYYQKDDLQLSIVSGKMNITYEV